MNIHNNDFSEKLLEGIEMNLLEVNENLKNANKEMKTQAASIKITNNEINEADEDVRIADLNIDQINSKKKCQIILMYLTAIVLSIIIMLLVVFKFSRI